MASKQRIDLKRPTPTDREEADAQLIEQQRVIEYDTKEFTIELLVQKFGKGQDEDDIYVPLYQREFSWEEKRQSRFIESVLMGLPIPFLFFGDMPDGRLEVVDGLQRLKTCKAFLEDELMLVDCERLNKLDGFRFSDLPKAQQRRVKNRTIRAVVLTQNATEADRRDLFDRINTGSLIAKRAEVRRGSMPGPVTDLVDELAGDARFQRLCPVSIVAARKRDREEIVSRFFALLDGIRRDNLAEYDDRLREYIDSWLETMNERAQTDPKLTMKLRKEFDQVMRFVDKNFPFGFTKGPRSNFTPKVRFDAIAVGVAEALHRRPGLKLSKGPETWLASEEFFTLTTSNAANVRSRVLARIAFVRDSLLEA